MKKTKFNKIIALAMAVAMTTLSFAGCGSDKKKDFTEGMSEEEKQKWEQAAADPYGKYPELITYTTGYNLTNQGSDTLANTPYEKDTTGNNAYTRYLKEVLNVQNKNAFEAISGPDYDQKVSMAIASGDLPDIMHVTDYKTLKELVESDLIEDLTDVYNNLACDTVRQSYASYGEQNNPLISATFDGKIMAIPKTQLSDGQDFLWLRKDWLDKLKLQEPKSLEDMEKVLKAFIEQDPDGNGQKDTMGLVVNSDVYGDYPNNTFAIDNIFTSFSAYPNIWIEKDGKAVYGSVQDEMKPALELLNRWYKEGLLDKEFATRTNDDVVGLISSGKCGAYIGPWWSPFNQAQTSTYAKEHAQWINVACPVGTDGKVQGINTKPYQGFVVVRKGYEHPELAMKIVNVQSEYAVQDKTEAVKEVKENQSIAYFNWPLYCKVQPANNAQIMTEHIAAVLDKKADVSTLSTEEESYYEAALRYLEAEENGKRADSADYSQYMSRLVAIYKMTEEPANFVTPAFFETTDSMATKWASLEKMEMETILKIIIGEKDINAFDEFVQQWNKFGGEQITNEVNEEISNVYMGAGKLFE